jgi:hypothetical protein
VLKRFALVTFLLVFCNAQARAQLGTLPFSGAPVTSGSFTPAWQSVSIGGGRS